MQNSNGLRTILICLIAVNALWVAISVLNAVGISLYELIPGAVYSLMSAASNLIEMIFYVLLLGSLPALTKTRD